MIHHQSDRRQTRTRTIAKEGREKKLKWPNLRQKEEQTQEERVERELIRFNRQGGIRETDTHGGKRKRQEEKKKGVR